MPAETLKPTHVLVIDDDPLMRDLLLALLAAENYLVEAAETGEAALSLLQNGLQPGVILTDVQLPGLSGPALATRLRTVAPQARLLGMSASEPGSATRAVFDAFLLKPFSMEGFAHSVATAQPPAFKLASRASGPPEPLDESTYNRMAATLPPAQLKELYQLTLADVATRLDSLQTALTTNDLDAFRREAHALKGGCSMVGAGELADLAAQAETAPTGVDAGTTFAALHPSFVRLCDILSPRLMHYR